MSTMPPLCKWCQVNRVRNRVDRGPRKGQWREHCSKRCALSAVRRQQSPEANRQARLAGNRAQMQQARLAALREVFGPLLDDRNRMISITAAIQLAMRFGQKQRTAGYKAALQRYARERMVS